MNNHVLSNKRNKKKPKEFGILKSKQYETNLTSTDEEWEPGVTIVTATKKKSSQCSVAVRKKNTKYQELVAHERKFKICPHVEYYV